MPIEFWLMFLAISEEFEADIIVVPNLAFCLLLFGVAKFLPTCPANCLCMALV